MFREFDDEFDIVIADPNQDLSQIVMTINAKLADGTNIVWNPIAGNSEITFTLPQGNYLGKSVNQNFVVIPESTSIFYLFFLMFFNHLMTNSHSNGKRIEKINR